MEHESRILVQIARECQSRFAQLVSATTQDAYYLENLMSCKDIQQMSERFNQWAGNLGALQSPGSPLSLDHRLQDAHLVKESLRESLTDLSSSIQDATDVAVGKRPNRSTGSRFAKDDPDLAEFEISSSDSSSSSASGLGSRSALAPTTEIQELESAIRLGLENLFKTSIFIRKFTSRDRRKRAAASKPFDNRADIMYLKDRYPSLVENSTLAARLGEANARRRQYFKYRRDHNERLSAVSKRAEQDLKNESSQPLAPEARPTKTVSTAETKPSLLADTEATAFQASEAQQAQMLRDTEPSEAMSAVSFATSVVETSNDELSFPSVSAEAQTGSPFLCPYCLEIQQFKRGPEQQWRNHVLKDLEPYICTFPSCSLDTYQSQNTWFEHELLEHRSRWVCSDCRLDFSCSDDLAKHVNKHHRSNISQQQLSAYIEQAKRPVHSIQPTDCPFCDDLWARTESSHNPSEEVLVVDLDQFRRHVGRHLQQVALFSLPRLRQDRDQSLGSHTNAAASDQDIRSKSLRWIREDCGRGWNIVARRRETFFALAFFLQLGHPKSESVEPLSLFSAASQGRGNDVVRLIAEGADVNGKNENDISPLAAAASHGHEGIVRLLLLKGADVNAHSKEGTSALFMAASKGHEGIVRLLLLQGADVNAQSKEGTSALFMAASKGHEEIIKLLLLKAANVDAQSKEEGSALYAASLKGHENILKLLLNSGAIPNAQGGKYGNALQASSAAGHENIVRLLLNHGADSNQPGGEYHNALQAASAIGHLGVIGILVSRGAKINSRGGGNYSALHAAIQGGHDQAVRLLLKLGANVNDRRVDGRETPLIMASILGYQEIVQILLAYEAFVNARDDEDASALYHAASKGNLAVIQLLLTAGARVNSRGGKYGNCLNAAVHASHTEAVHILLEHGANIEAKDTNYTTAVYHAVTKGDDEMIRLLIEHGANLNGRRKGGLSLLQEAVRKGFKQTAQLLLDCGASVDSIDDYGYTALRTAARKGYSEIAALLLDRGARHDIHGRDGGPLRAAARYGHVRLVKMLLDNGASLTDDEESGMVLFLAASHGFIEIVQLLLEYGVDPNGLDWMSLSPLDEASREGHKDIVQLLADYGARYLGPRLSKIVYDETEDSLSSESEE